MITLKVSGHWLGMFLTQGYRYDPILITKGLPEGAKFVGASVDHDSWMLLLRYEAPGPDVEMEAELVNVEKVLAGPAGNS